MHSEPILESVDYFNPNLEPAIAELETGPLPSVGPAALAENVAIVPVPEQAEEVEKLTPAERSLKKRTEEHEAWIDKAYADTDLLDTYMKQARRYPLLKKEDEVRLAQTREAGLAAQEKLASEQQVSPEEMEQLQQQIRNGLDAEEEFINCNLRLVVSIASKYAKASSLSLLDLIQEGNTGLQRAVEKFEWRKGFKFSTYATWWIRQAITRGMHNTSRTIRMPVHISEKYNKILSTRSELYSTLGRRPTDEEVADAVGVSAQVVSDTLRYAYVSRTDSINRQISNDNSFSESEIGDKIADQSSIGESDDSARSEACRATLEDLFASARANDLPSTERLNEREEFVLKYRFGLEGVGEHTLQEVGKPLNITRERIRQLEKTGLRKLQAASVRLNIDIRELLADN